MADITRDQNRVAVQSIKAGTYKSLPDEALRELLDYVDYTDKDNVIKVVPDPKVWGTFALRIFRSSDNYVFDLLWYKGGFDEVDFEQFPPVSGDLKFM